MKNKIIILIPGFKGSRIIKKVDQKLIWLTLWEIFFGRSSLKLQNKDIYTANGILSAIPVIPGIIEIDIYKSFLKKCEVSLKNNFRIIEFSYDWRKDIIDSVEKLNRLIDSFKNEYSISIAAHSMGGLITAYYLRYGSQQPDTAKENWSGLDNIDKIIMAGVPFKGSLQIFCEIQNGANIALNNRLLDYEAMSSFPSVYQLLPDPDIRCVHNEKDYINIYEVDNWEKYKWGLYKKPGLNSGEAEKYGQFLKKNLARVLKIKNLINSETGKKINHKIKILNITGINKKTPSSLFIKNKNYNISYFDGDGTVTADSSELPAYFTDSFSIKEINMPCRHANLFENRNSQAKILDFFFYN